jgi:archaellum component FlaC
MAGHRTAGWAAFQNAINNLAEERIQAAKGKVSDRDMQDSVLLGLQQVTDGLEDSLQELYERIERLHQKIDRIEKKVGSA